MNPQTQTNQKAKQFSEELNELLAKYQYQLVPELTVTKTGIMPSITIHETLPPKGNVNPSPAIQTITEKPEEFEETPSGTTGAIIKKGKK